MGGAKFYRFALFPLMLLMLLLVPTRMVAETTTEDPRYALFNGLDGITDVTITDNGSYSWKMLDLNADGMKNLGFTIPDGSKGLMSSNYHVDGSTSETVIKFKVSKPILLTSQVLVSSKKSWDIFSIYVDNKLNLQISDKKQTEYKVLLSVGEHSLTLHYKKYSDYSLYADRAFLYNLKTSTTIDDYVADYESSNKTMTFKSIKSDNLGALNLNRIAMVNNDQTVSNMCSLLNIEKSAIKNIVFDKSINTYTPTSLNSFFGDLDELQTITDLKYLNTANVTDMSYMFYSCQELSSLDLTNFNTANVTDMGNMFEGCSALTSLDLTNFNTANVENMSSMFYDCSALKSLDLTNFNTANVTYMNNMFEGCSALTTIYASDKFDTDNVWNGLDMFTGCKSLKDYSDSKTDHNYANYGPDGYFTPVFDYAEFDNATGTLTFRRGLSKPEGAYDLNVESNLPGWDAQREKINKVVFDASFANAKPTSCYAWFSQCSNLTEIEGIENLNTQNVTDMRDMFTCCYALTSLDVSIFNTQNVKNMNGMFCDCSNLTSLDLTNFNTAKVTNMGNMFLGCSNLTSLDLTNFNTAKVTDMHYMFKGCSALTSLDLTNFNTAEVRDMNRMFNMLDKSSTALTTIYVSDNFVTTNVQNGENMFKNCTKLKGFQKYFLPDTDHRYANYKTGYFTKLVGKNGEEKIGATGETLATENLVLDDGKGFVVYEPFAAKTASYSRDIPKGSTWGTLCLPFAIDQSKETECKFYRLTGIDNDCITLESYEGAEIPAGTPVLFKMNEGVKKLEISAQDADLVKEPVAGTASDVNLVGSFTKIGGNDNQGLDKNDYIIGKDKFWLVSELKKDGNSKGVGIKPMRAYIHPATASHARAAMLSIGKGDGTTAIDNLNAISNDANAEYYDANGRRTNGLQKGLNIVKRGSKTYKIMVK